MGKLHLQLNYIASNAIKQHLFNFLKIDHEALESV